MAFTKSGLSPDRDWDEVDRSFIPALTKSGLSPDRDWHEWVEVERPFITDDYVHVNKSDLESCSLPPVEDGEEDEEGSENNADVVLQLTRSQEEYMDRLLMPKIEQMEKELREQNDCNYSAAMEKLFGSDAKEYQLMFNAAIPELRFQPRHSRDSYSPRPGVLYTPLTTADKCKDAADLLLGGRRTRGAHGHNAEALSRDHPPSSEPGKLPEQEQEDVPSFTHSPDDVD
ncbi:hypothetical protein F5Y00DRAFT_270842 [Daldinia vernicosa]|uniref:uncharacterized protein n=1 Tax=Daldinia vernicosa TaxID=114800 RepID=UPI0020083BA2|nr:uncharacterized protein F5Y00DRAFT_270842 [Daldinia vernicosa]KAI0847914.1 hypothetical protein F5Y00DRAFT_270842 [Daldinia vernicosa]